MKLMLLFDRSDNEKRDTIDEDDVVVITVEKKVLMAISLWNKKVINLCTMNRYGHVRILRKTIAVVNSNVRESDYVYAVSCG